MAKKDLREALETIKSLCQNWSYKCQGSEHGGYDVLENILSEIEDIAVSILKKHKSKKQNTNKKKSKIKWYRVLEGSNSIDNRCHYVYSVNQPDVNYRPVSEKYFNQKSRFLKK